MKETHPIQKLKNLYHKFQSAFASRKYSHPQNDLVIIGVTGTDGKTTTTSMIYHVLKSAGLPVGYISTIKAEFGDKQLDTGFHVTTPDPQDLPRYLKMMKDDGVKFVILESTSSGLQQNRLHGINFDSGIITNIRNDHLDYHGTWENYAKAKFRLVEMMKDKGLAVLNNDDEVSANWIKKQSNNIKQDIYVKWISFSDIKNPKQSIEGISFEYLDTHFEIPLVGEHNFHNALQVINLCLRYTDISVIAKALSTFTSPEGRMEIIQKEPFAIIVDFAHTPNALNSALESVTKIQKNNGRIITIFGCAGRRDKGRRLMGEVSAKLSDITILTAEDPRDEKLASINDNIIEAGKKANGQLIYRVPNNEDFRQMHMDVMIRSIDEALESGKKPFIAFDEDNINSRRDAIEFALKIAKKGDIVFSTGKGHEKSLAFGEKETEYPWSDQAVIKEFITSMNL